MVLPSKKNNDIKMLLNIKNTTENGIKISG